MKKHNLKNTGANLKKEAKIEQRVGLERDRRLNRANL